MNGKFFQDALQHMTPDEQEHYISAGLVWNISPVVADVISRSLVKLEESQDLAQERKDTITRASTLLRDGVDGDNLTAAVQEVRNIFGF